MIRIVTQTLKIASILVITLIVIVGAAAFFDYWTNRVESDEIGRPVTIRITEDDDGGSVADKLSDSGLIKYGFYFETRLRFSEDELIPGTYTLKKGMSVNDIIDEITGPSTANADDEADNAAPSDETFSVTFVEGQRMEEYAVALADAGWQGDPQEFLDAAGSASQWEGFWFLDGLPADASTEGFLFPNTYTFNVDASGNEIVERLLTEFANSYTDDMRADADGLGFSTLEVVTLGSIVEREVAVPDERPIVAALYENRLDQGMPLQTDPTLQYAIGTADDWWPDPNNTQAIEQASGSPYNTYEIEGLPPGPIANPGLASLQSVLQPANVDYLYMVARADGSGSHLFSTTYEEHQQNLCQERPDSEDCGGGNHLDPSTILAWVEPRWVREAA